MTTDPDIKYFLGKLAGSMEAMESDISEIKQAQIPDGQNRMSHVEQKVQSLNVWKGTIMGLAATVGGAFTWVATNLDKFLGGH